MARRRPAPPERADLREAIDRDRGKPAGMRVRVRRFEIEAEGDAALMGAIASMLLLTSARARKGKG